METVKDVRSDVVTNINTHVMVGKDKVFEGHRHKIREMFVTDKFLITSSNDELVRVWDIFTQKCICILRYKLASYTKICVNNKLLVVANEYTFSDYSVATVKATINVWELDHDITGTCSYSLHDNHIDTSIILHICVGDNIIVCKTCNMIIHIWDINTKTCTQVIKNTSESYICLIGNTLINRNSPAIEIWKVCAKSNRYEIVTLLECKSNVTSMCGANNLLFVHIYTSITRQIICCWDITTYECIFSKFVRPNALEDLVNFNDHYAFLCINKYMSYNCFESYIHIMDFTEFGGIIILLYELDRHRHVLSNINENILVTYDSDHKIHVVPIVRFPGEQELYHNVMSYYSIHMNLCIEIEKYLS